MTTQPLKNPSTFEGMVKLTIVIVLLFSPFISILFWILSGTYTNENKQIQTDKKRAYRIVAIVFGVYFVCITGVGIKILFTPNTS